MSNKHTNANNYKKVEVAQSQESTEDLVTVIEGTEDEGYLIPSQAGSAQPTILNKDVEFSIQLQHATNVVVGRSIKVIKPFASDKNGCITSNIKNSWSLLGINPLIIAAFSLSALQGRNVVLSSIPEAAKLEAAKLLDIESFDKIHYTTDSSVLMYYSCEDESERFAGSKGAANMFAEIVDLYLKGCTAKAFGIASLKFFELKKAKK